MPPHGTGARPAGVDAALRETPAADWDRAMEKASRSTKAVGLLASLLHRFARHTSMHGVPRLIRARSPVARLFWLLVCLIATSLFCVELTQLLRKYFSYPKRVSIEVVPLAMSFPAISLCNMRNLDVIVLNKLNTIFKAAGDPLAWDNYTDDPFIDAYMTLVSKYYPMYQRNDIDMRVFQTVLTRRTIATNIDRRLVTGAGVPFREFIVTCQFGGEECDREADFKPFFDTYYYNCFTYTARAPAERSSMLAEGTENGWTATVLSGSGMLTKNADLRTLPGTHDRFSAMAGAEGVRVVIHPPDTQPFPHAEGFDVPPGYAVTFGVRARVNRRIGPPHGNCSATNPFADAADPYAYRLLSCQKQCVQHAVVARCGCKDGSLPAEQRFRALQFCNHDGGIAPSCRYNATEDCVRALYAILRRLNCARRWAAKVSRNATAMRQCGCLPACDEVAYDITYSLSRWPADSFDGEEVYIDIFGTERYHQRFTGERDREKTRLYEEYFSVANRRTAMKNFAKLNVFVADSNVLKTVESPDYTQSQLLSDIGGQLGLWVGISVITLAEVVELVVDIGLHFIRRHGPYSRGRRFHRDPEAGLASGGYEPALSAPGSVSPGVATSSSPRNGNLQMSHTDADAVF